MKSTAFLISIALWVVTVGFAAYFFVNGNTAPSSDQRRAILLSAPEKDLVLGEMRGILSAVNGIFEGLSKSDLPAIAEAASTAGMGMAADVNPALMAKLPLEFKSLGMSLHRDFDELSAKVRGGMGRDQVITRMAEMTRKCVACHQTYRLGIN